MSFHSNPVFNALFGGIPPLSKAKNITKKLERFNRSGGDFSFDGCDYQCAPSGAGFVVNLRGESLDQLCAGYIQSDDEDNVIEFPAIPEKTSMEKAERWIRLYGYLSRPEH